MADDAAGTETKKRRRRRVLTLESKVKIIRMNENGVSSSEVGRRFGLARSTIVSIIQNKQEILNAAKSVTPRYSFIIRKRDNAIASMEKRLIDWIIQQRARYVPMTQSVIQRKALEIFAEMRNERVEAGETEDVGFVASRGWYNRFKRRSNLNAQGGTLGDTSRDMDVPDDVSDMLDTIMGEADFPESQPAEPPRTRKRNRVNDVPKPDQVDTAVDFSHELARIVSRENYSDRQIFNVYETGLFWKRMPSKTSIAQDDLSRVDLKVAQDRLSLLFCSNAAGDFKLKPMLVYHSENPKALKNYSKSSLPVYWKTNSKTLITAPLFEDWFSNYFVPSVREYCAKEKMPFKVLLLLDDYPCHPKSLSDLNSEVRVIFLPLNSTALLERLDQGVIPTFCCYYTRRIFSKAVAAVDRECETAKTKAFVVGKFWEGFTILDGIKNIREAWDEVKPSLLKRVFGILCPQFMCASGDSENSVEDAAGEIVEMAKLLELDVYTEDVFELVASHSRLLSQDDFIELDKHRRKEEVSAEFLSSPVPKVLTCNELSKAFKLLEQAMSIFENADPNFERSSRVNAGILDQYACYRSIYRDKKRKGVAKISIDNFLYKNQQSETQSDDLSPTSSTNLLQRKCITTEGEIIEEDDDEMHQQDDLDEDDSKMELFSFVKMN